MSDHVVVPVDWVKDYAWCCEFIAKTSKLDPTIRNEQAKKARDLLKQPSPEMVPMDSFNGVIAAVECLRDIKGRYNTETAYRQLMEALDSFHERHAPKGMQSPRRKKR